MNARLICMGCVVMFNLEVPHPKLEVVGKFLAFLFGPDDCGEESSSYVIFDPSRHQVVEKKCYADDEAFLHVLHV